MRRLICVFVVRIWHKQVFSWRGSYVCINIKLLIYLLPLLYDFCYRLELTFALKLLGLSQANFMWSLWFWGTKACSINSGHMTKMVAMLVFCKSLNISGTNRILTLKLGLGPTMYVQMMILGWLFTARSDLLPIKVLFLGKLFKPSELKIGRYSWPR